MQRQVALITCDFEVLTNSQLSIPHLAMNRIQHIITDHDDSKADRRDTNIQEIRSRWHVSCSRLYSLGQWYFLGKGAYGAVYKGLHIPSNSVVALKIIDLDTADDDTADIQREVALLSQLRADDTNITKYHGCWLEGPRVWIVMDFASGGSVRTLAKCIKDGALEERWIMVIVREVLVALSYLHKSNVIHRDIKTANILVQDSSKIVLCDFGVSALLPSSNAKRTTFIGTPHYMAPEVLTSSAYDSKADIWSLGITIYEMATGSQPLAEIPQLQAISLIPKIKPPRLPDQFGSREMKDFLACCLRELPSDVCKQVTSLLDYAPNRDIETISGRIG